MKRPEGMNYFEYRAVRISADKAIKNYLRCKLVWNSHYQGTYIRAKHGELK